MSVDANTYGDFQRKELEWSKLSNGMRDVNFIDPNTGESYNKIIERVPKALLKPQSNGLVRFAFQHPVERNRMVYTDISQYCLGWTNQRFKLTRYAGYDASMKFFDLSLDRDYKFAVHVTENYKERECFDMKADDLAALYEQSQAVYRKEHGYAEDGTKLPVTEKPDAVPVSYSESDDSVKVLEDRPPIVQEGVGEAIVNLPTVDEPVVHDPRDEFGFEF